MKRIALLSLIIMGSFSSLHCQTTDTLKTGTFIDKRDGLEYKWVKIGDQVWMAENLNYNTGSDCWVYKNNPSYAATYGLLYPWNVAMGVCPSGWHLPSEAEWTELSNYLGGRSIAGGKLKEEGLAHWESPNLGATNESGFSGLPGGYRNQNGGFHTIGSHGQWWSATENMNGVLYMDLYNKNSKLRSYVITPRNTPVEKVGFSVRCVKN